MSAQSPIVLVTFKSEVGVAKPPSLSTLHKYLQNKIQKISKGITLRHRRLTNIAGSATSSKNLPLSPKELGTLGLNSPYFMALDEKRQILYVSDYSSGRIHKINVAANEYISCIEHFVYRGTPDRVEKFKDPAGIVVDSTGDVFVCDASQCSVIRIPRPSTNPNEKDEAVCIIGRLTSGDADGVGDQVMLSGSRTFSINSKDEIFFPDNYNNKIKKIDIKTRTVTTIAGTGEMGTKNGPLNACTFSDVWVVAVNLDNEDEIFVGEYGEACVRKISLKAGTIVKLDLDYTGLEPAPTLKPRGMFCKYGKMLITDDGNHIIWEIDLTESSPKGHKVSLWSGGGKGIGEASFKTVGAIVPDELNNCFYISDFHRLWRVD